MKVFNLTDMPTATLEQYGMSNHTIVVGQQSVAPGASVEVAATDEAATRAHLEHFIAIGALAIDTPPTTYHAGGKKPSEAPPADSPPVEKAERDRDRNQRRRE